MPDVVIQMENVSKQYRLGYVGTRTLKGDFNRWFAKIRGKEDPTLIIGSENKLDFKNGDEYVWALQDINMEVKRGEVLGIIGKNGAGKSTLLKIMSRVTGPTTGQIKMKGRVGSLLEVGTGFHKELTGSENIFLNGAILGMTKDEIKSKLDGIVDFSGVLKYIDTPVKRYSSGMYVRLAFAVAAFLEPDILVVDEVLAVGDAEFQKKAIGKMQHISSQGGRTVLFVSHNMASIKALCTECIVLENGKIAFYGDTNDAISFYQNQTLGSITTTKIWNENNAPGNGKIKIFKINVEPIIGKILDVDSGVVIKIKFENFLDISNLGITVELLTKEEIVVFHVGTQISKNKNSQKGLYNVSLEIPPSLLNTNIYKLNLIFGEKQRYQIFRVNDIFSFKIENTNTTSGSNVSILPGVIKPKLKFDCSFLGNDIESS